MEWIMINVRIGKETFCKYAAESNVMYTSLTCTPLSLKRLCASFCVLFAQSCPFILYPTRKIIYLLKNF